MTGYSHLSYNASNGIDTQFDICLKVLQAGCTTEHGVSGNEPLWMTTDRYNLNPMRPEELYSQSSTKRTHLKSMPWLLFTLGSLVMWMNAGQ